MKLSAWCFLCLLPSALGGRESKERKNPTKKIKEYGGVDFSNVMYAETKLPVNSTNVTLSPLDGNETLSSESTKDPIEGSMVTWDEEETDAPSQTPTTSELTEAPTTEPTVEPTAEPTLTPTTLEPTIEPTTLAPTIKPTLKPISSAPTVAPSATPTSATPVQTSSPTKRGLPAPFQCGLCPDYRFPGAHEKIFANGAISATCLELDVMLTSTEENEECIELMDQIGYEIDVWSFCECPGIDPPGLCELCPGVSKAEVPQNKMVDGLFCSEWAHYAENALDDAYCANLQQRVGTAGTCCPYHYGLQTLQVYAKKNP